MGESRRRRMAAKAMGLPHAPIKPVRHAQLMGEITQKLNDTIDQRYDKVNRATCPTRWAFIERLLIAGIASFDAEEQQQNQTDLVKLADMKEMAEAAKRLQALKGGKK